MLHISSFNDIATLLLFIIILLFIFTFHIKEMETYRL